MALSELEPATFRLVATDHVWYSQEKTLIAVADNEHWDWK
jgi:hypothetical protein